MDVIDRGLYAGGFNIPYDVFELGVVAQALQDEFDCGSFVVDVGVFGDACPGVGIDGSVMFSLSSSLHCS